MNPEFEDALEAVEEIVEADPRGFRDRSPDVSWQLDEADIAVVDDLGGLRLVVVWKAVGHGPAA